LKKSFSNWEASLASNPRSTLIRWLRRLSSTILKTEPQAPALGSGAV